MKRLFKLIQSNKGKKSFRDPFVFEPRILINRDKKLAMLWSPKSACSFSIKWFLYQMNQLDAALYYNRWIHNYRIEVYYESQRYKEDIIHFRENIEEYLVLKVVRNPVDRAVSSFFGIPKRYCFNDFFPLEHKLIEKSIRRKLRSPNGETLSFREFVDYLATRDLSKVDMHWGEQMHPLEKSGAVVPRIIKLENVVNNLKEIEKEYKLDRTDFDKIRGSKHHAKKDINIEEFWGDSRIKYDHNKKYPGYKNFYDESIRDKIYKIYKSDFDAYGYLNQL
jgi:hypothetical protein